MNKEFLKMQCEYNGSEGREGDLVVKVGARGNTGKQRMGHQPAVLWNIFREIKNKQKTIIQYENSGSAELIKHTHKYSA